MTSYHGVDENYQSELANTPEKLKQYQLENYYDGKWKSDYDQVFGNSIGWLSGPDYPVIAWNSSFNIRYDFHAACFL